MNPEFWFDKAGPAAIWVVMAIVFAETGLFVGFFLPGDSLLFFTGFLTSSAAMDSSVFGPLAKHLPSLVVVLPLLFIAAVVGNQVGYFFGRKVGSALFHRPDSRLFKQENVAKAHDFFEKYGAKSVFLAQFVPIVRTFTPIVAGVSQMDYRKFVRWNVFGAFCWTIGVTTLGHFLGQISFVRDNIELAIVAVIAVSLTPMAIEIIKHRRAAKAGISDDTPVQRDTELVVGDTELVVGDTER
ncbi:MAG: VTT domain-containing protein [Actinobacteria bacterium]|nr:VTT domain-containing protein [Actinomycetota bacterium]